MRTWKAPPFGMLFAAAFAAVAMLLATGAQAQPQSRLYDVTKSKKLRVCQYPLYYSISFRNPKTGLIEGIDADLAKELAKELGAELEIVESGFATFIADLNGLVDRFEQANQARQAGKDRQAAARASIEAALASGFVALHKLDAIITNHLRGDAVTMAVWRGDRRIDYRSRKRSTRGASTPTPASGPAPTSADAGATPVAQGGTS